jgi:hypothetical protein
VRAEKVGVVAPTGVVFRKIATDEVDAPRMPTTRSGFPSPLRSPVAADVGEKLAGRSVLENAGVGLPDGVVLSRTDTVSRLLARA